MQDAACVFKFHHVRFENVKRPCICHQLGYLLSLKILLTTETGFLNVYWAYPKNLMVVNMSGKTKQKEEYSLSRRQKDHTDVISLRNGLLDCKYWGLNSGLTAERLLQFT